MNLQNGYKVIYEKTSDGKRTFYGSTAGVFEGADVITEVEMGKYKLIYEKAGKIYGSTTGVPTDNDDCFTEFDLVFKAAEDEVVETPEENADSSESGDKSAEEPSNEPDGEEPDNGLKDEEDENGGEWDPQGDEE